MNGENESEARFWARIVATILSSVNSIMGRIGRAFPWFRHWLGRPVIVPHQRANWWHMGRTGEGKPTMQIVSYWYVTNNTDEPVRILNTYLKWPMTQGHVLVKDVHSNFHGSFPIPPHTTTELHADFWVEPPVRGEGRDFVTDVVFIDQHGCQRKKRKVRFRSDRRKGRAPRALRQEAIFELEHEVEKKVAATLKDEINRYKQYGRAHGELGSVHAILNGRKVKQIYGDSWTSSRSGEQQEIIGTCDDASVQSENGDALVALYESLTVDAERKLFVNALTARLNKDFEYYCVSYLIFYVLFRIGQLEPLLDGARVGLTSPPTLWGKVFKRKAGRTILERHQRHGRSDMLGLINGLMRYEPGSFSNAELDLLEAYIADVGEHTFRIAEKINAIRSSRL